MLKQIFLYLALIWTGTVLFFCLINANEIKPISIPNFDKLVHAGFHFIFTVLWFLVFKKNLKNTTTFKSLMTALIFSFLFGISIELMQQYLTMTRTADVFDVLANSFGSISAVFAVIVLNKWNGVVDKI